MYSPSRYSKSMPACATSASAPAARVRKPGKVRDFANSPYAATRSASGGQDRTVHHRLCRRERRAVERSKPPNDPIDVEVEFGVGDRTGDPAPSLGAVCVVVSAGENDFEHSG